MVQGFWFSAANLLYTYYCGGFRSFLLSALFFSPHLSMIIRLWTMHRNGSCIWMLFSLNNLFGIWISLCQFITWFFLHSLSSHSLVQRTPSACVLDWMNGASASSTDNFHINYKPSRALHDSFHAEWIIIFMKRGHRSIRSRPKAHVCMHFVCRLPVPFACCRAHMPSAASSLTISMEWSN